MNQAGKQIAFLFLVLLGAKELMEKWRCLLSSAASIIFLRKWDPIAPSKGFLVEMDHECHTYPSARVIDIGSLDILWVENTKCGRVSKQAVGSMQILL